MPAIKNISVTTDIKFHNDGLKEDEKNEGILKK